ncbi:tetratricopeptide (TPR) repeat protein [Pedobacter sp. UYP24]
MSKAYVNVWAETVVIPTYGIGKPDKNPMFFEKRIYQGSSGVVYPHPVIEKIYDEKEEKEYKALFLENEYLKIMILPELGGRIQMAYDKIKERHFIYYNQVIKPALVGLTGPWISGGIEFNWPQHHRPSTFDPIDYKIEENADGSKTIWVNEIEQMFHTKGLAGFTLYPDKAYIEIKAKLLNRSGLPQTFLWWANPAVKVNDHYQSVFPPDVNAVFDHGKRDVSTFPIATGTYYKVDYSPGTDISRYINIPVPTSYMAINSEYDFVGGYEHDTQGGLLHVANHHVSPGKKQWTWGHSDFGQAWDRNLTDEDGPYIELMTGMFTDNQPDFTWLLPNEEKSFTQYFMPYKELGVIKNATKDILIALDKSAFSLVLKIYVTSVQKDVQLQLSYKGTELFSQQITIDPKEVFVKELTVDDQINENELLLIINAANGKELIRYEPAKNKQNEMPVAAKPAVSPQETENNEQLFLTAQHLEQYRHATYSPVPYYEEALKRDAKDCRCNNALGLWYLRRGQFAKSEQYFRRAIETITQRNPNPCDTEVYYNLGLCLKYQDKQEEAYKVFYKATWGRAYQDSGFFAVAQIDLSRGDYELALEHIGQAIDNNANNSQAYVVKAVALRHSGFLNKAVEVSNYALQRDPFNLGAIYELHLTHNTAGHEEQSKGSLNQLIELSRGYAQNFIAYANDYAASGLFEEAVGLINQAILLNPNNPLLHYYAGWFQLELGEKEEALTNFKLAALAPSYLCFPNRLEEIKLFMLAMKLNPEDAKAPYYLGNIYYDKRQYDDAIKFWEMAVQLDPEFPTALRNLGIACYNKKGAADKALQLYEAAFELDNTDARILMELDQLYKRLLRTPEERKVFLEKHMNTLMQRDDLYLEYVSLLNFTGNYQQALDWISIRQFHPWEGGEGKASGQYLFSLIEIAKAHLANQEFEEAIGLLERAQVYPHNLGEGKLYGAQENDIQYWLGKAWQAKEDPEKAKLYFEQATVGLDEPSAAMFYNDQQPDKIFYQGLAYQELGWPEQAEAIFNKLVNYGIQHLNDVIIVDYFAVSLPNLLIFEDDLNLRNKAHCQFIQGLGYLGLKNTTKAIAAFNEVLSLDPEHVGANTHINMPN